MVIDGELSFPRMREWLQQADDLAGRGCIDLSGIKRMDSAGAAFLLEITRRANRRGLDLIFINAGPQPRGLLEFLQINNVLRLGN
ncbi:MAG: STAS domain-containing protein [Panacagrimonas sp.]